MHALKSRSRTRNCGHCSKPFEAKRTWQRFCSTDCRTTFHNKLTKQAREAWIDQAEKVSDGQQTE